MDAELPAQRPCCTGAAYVFGKSDTDFRDADNGGHFACDSLLAIRCGQTQGRLIAICAGVRLKGIHRGAPSAYCPQESRAGLRLVATNLDIEARERLLPTKRT